MSVKKEDLVSMIKSAAMRRKRILSQEETDRGAYVVQRYMDAHGWSWPSLAVSMIEHSLDGLGIRRL